MQDLIVILLDYGGLLVGYGCILLIYLICRKKAQRHSAGRPIIQTQVWKSFSSVLCAGLLIGASIWTTVLAYVFANLIPF